MTIRGIVVRVQAHLGNQTAKKLDGFCLRSLIVKAASQSFDLATVNVRKGGMENKATKR